MAELKLGVYRHYKGGEYQILNIAKNSETKIDEVVYQDLSDKSKIWTRPLAMFLEAVEVAGQPRPRFEFISEVPVKRAVVNHPEAVVGPIIYNSNGEILLIKNPKFGDFWCIPGGHIEMNESAEEALKRETREETGLELKNISPISFGEGINPSFFHEKRHFIYLNYLAELAGGEITKSDEMTEYIWISPEKALELQIAESVRPLIEYYLAQQTKGDDSWEHQYKRALADYQNLLKQTTKDKQDFVKYALSEFLEEVLPVYDHLKMSVSGLSEAEEKNPWVAGVRHVLKQFKEVLANHGLEEIPTSGQKYDHHLMEAVGGSGETVSQEIMPGYTLNGRLIRPAKVIVKQ